MSDISCLDKSRLNEIDLFRFLAAMSVVFFHYAFRGVSADNLSAMPYPLLAPIAKYGYLGVDFFFMISGFVILMSTANGRLQAFLISRVIRLYPAFWVGCSVTFLAILLFGAPRFESSLSHYAINLTMFGGYFGVPSMDGVYWSLFIECRFYLLIAVVLAFRLIDRIELLFGVWLLVAAKLHFRPVGLIDRILITDYASYFVAGGILHVIRINGLSWYRLMLLLAAFLLSTLKSIQILPGLEDKYHESFDPLTVAFIVASFYFLLLAVALGRTLWLRRCSWMWAGSITYPLYLLHQNLGYIAFNRLHDSINHHVLFWSVLIVVLLCSYAVHVFVERPLAPRLRFYLNILASRIQWPRLTRVGAIG